MRTFNFLLLAMLSCIAMIGAAPIGNGAPAEAIERRKSEDNGPPRVAEDAIFPPGRT
ncbi:hypothetical protein DFH94DRAFT_691148 [Russula ochroleuca]|uniref:Uncharacterized protein n=1 Tax=Russula ochroleuca TaxID=152965 RepID=A0A9P5N057_9AGAM|nr:hypothetical protein DFH94DRAFT_691148 [Russula ochroleuca]